MFLRSRHSSTPFMIPIYGTGLNCGRWDYIFSYIKMLRAHPDRILTDRSAVTMTQPFLRAYVLNLIQACHQRGVHAMGGACFFILCI